VIYVTEAPNDQDLLPLLGGIALPAPIPHGDFCFFGVWEELRAIRVCGERKKISDLVQCITITGRHLKQVQDAREAGFEFIFLVTEGLYRPGENGELEVREGNKWVPYYPAIEYYRVDSYLNELQWYMGVVVKRSSSPRETARLVLDMYRLFQEPPEQHDSLKRFYSIPAPMRYRDWKKKPSLLRRVSQKMAETAPKITSITSPDRNNLTCSPSAPGSDALGLPRVGPLGRSAPSRPRLALVLAMTFLLSYILLLPYRCFMSISPLQQALSEARDRFP